MTTDRKAHLDSLAITLLIVCCAFWGFQQILIKVALPEIPPLWQATIRMVANDLHRLNQSVMKAVEAGVSVELVRSARHHGGEGNWGDLLIPVIVTQGRG